LQQQEARLAFASYSAQVDFRQFDISTAWAERFSTAFGAGGNFPFASVTYDSSLTVNFDRPDFTDGHLRILGDDFVQDALGNVTAGLVRAIVGSFSEGISTAREFYITGASVSAVTFHAAMRTANLVDDQAVLRDLFRGSDIITLSSFSDFALGFDGNDTISGNGGADRLFGVSGNDLIRGGYGNDSVYGNLGADQLIGGPGADVMQGGVGNDTLTGGGGVDIFEFRAGDNNDRVLDWIDGVDRLRIYGTPGSVTVNLTELAGGDMRLSVLGMQIVIENAVLADFQLETGSGYIDLV
jgi:RTX calcium-binding nonapeptide repeat (4 copies)